MAYWWVSQNQSFKQERTGGFLWAPNQNEEGHTYFHWATMNRVQPGDVIFSFVGGKIVAVSVARTAAYDNPRPRDLGEGLWEDAGKRIDAEYRDLSTPLPIADMVADFKPLLPEMYSPLNRNGTGNQGYLFGLLPRAGRFLLDRVAGVTQDAGGDTIQEGIVNSVRDSTQRRALVLSRIGQGQFRESLMSVWGGRCVVTGLDLSALLRASHIKPWRDSDNQERLDRYNGLLLSPAYDAGFDAGLITFDEDGMIRLSSQLTVPRTEQLGISSTAMIEGLQDRHRPYLAYHRQEVFDSSL